MEERLKFLSSGVKPRKNKEAMNEVIEELKKEGLFYGDKVRVAKEDGDAEGADSDEEPKKEKKDKKKKDKKDKKRKHSEVAEDSDEEVAKPEKKKKKKSKD